MQSSSSGMLSVLGLLACATVAGMFAAKKWPQGPPRDLPLRAWDWLAAHAAPQGPGAASETRYDGPAPKFDPSLPSAAPEHEAAGGFAPPTVEYAEQPPEAEQSAAGPANPSAVTPPAPTGGAPLVVRPASVAAEQPSQANPSRYEPGQASPFWPSDLADLLPPGGVVEAKSPASPRSRVSESGPPSSSPPAASIEQLVRRLEQMGAVVVRLERQRGTAGYFFRCELPFPQNPRYHRFFQAADAEPAAAIQRVLREVEAWKAAERR